MKIQQIKAGLYAVGKRMQGYELLKNPKGVPSTTVSVIRRTSRSSTPFSFDFKERLTVITKDFANENNQKIVKKFDTIGQTFYANMQTHFLVNKRFESASFSNSATPNCLKQKSKSYSTLDPDRKSSIRNWMVDDGFSVADTVENESQNLAESCSQNQYKKTFKKDGFWKTLMSNLSQ